jgi:hypothetical protein
MLEVTFIMEKEMPYVGERECIECGRIFEPNNINEDLCSFCAQKIKKAQKRAGKKKKWYKGKRELE